MRFSSLLIVVSSALGGSGVIAADVDFVKHIQPVFKEHCISCHGEETSEAGLRLDRRADALAGGDSGKAILPGDADGSLLIKMVTGADPDNIMPPDGDNLSPAQITLLRSWIDAGADWPQAADPPPKKNEHWAYAPLQELAPPEELGVDSAIDAWIAAPIRAHGVDLSPIVDRRTALKRLSYDLLGLPVEVADLREYLADESPWAWERQVDRLLASPHFGERWGRHWLDAARYADSDGYEKDQPRDHAWKFRDWVIDAYNSDLPFDQFTIQQLAGDLLPDAPLAARVATGFQRQTLTNTEGGTDKEEFRVAAVADRIETLGAVWLGLTVGCAKCHTHKYDAITQREYYALFAFFDNAEEATIQLPSSTAAWDRYSAEQADYENRLAVVEAPLQARRKELQPQFKHWLQELRTAATSRRLIELTDLTAPDAVRAEASSGAALTSQPDGGWLASGALRAEDDYSFELTWRPSEEVAAPSLTGIELTVLPDSSLPGGGPGRSPGGNFVLSEIRAERLTDAEVSPVEFAFAQADHSQDKYDVQLAIDGVEDTRGWAIAPQTGKAHTARFHFKRPVQASAGDRWRIRLVHRFEGDPHTLGRWRLRWIAGGESALAELPWSLDEALALPAEKLKANAREALFQHFAMQQPGYGELHSAVESVRRGAPFRPEMPVAVLEERTQERRVTRVHRRGDFQQQLDPVDPGTFSTLPPLPAATGAAPTRLDLARWLMSPEHPLTGRVAVNQIWSHLFGRGLVSTPNDFGVRGERPTHPELLDWLARAYRDEGWGRKQLIRRIVISRTYRQSSARRMDLETVDPQNLLLARQNRFRVEAEIVSDLSLAASGLLSRRIGGPSVFPPLPPGIAELSYANNFRWGKSVWNERPDHPHGTAPEQDVHRRGLYTFFKRTAPHPNLTTFDCPDSNTSCVARNVSNTPLQALQTLNQQLALDTSRALAALAREASDDPGARINWMFERCVARQASDDERQALQDLVETARREFAVTPQAASQLSNTTAAVDEDAIEAAAWTVVARVLLNLDEFLTRE